MTHFCFHFVVALVCISSLGSSNGFAQTDIRYDQSVNVIEKVRPAVAVVYAFDKSGKRLGTGSGSVIDPRGYVLTAKHVVGQRHIVLLGGRPPVTAELIGTMPEFDIAILRLGQPAFKRAGSPNYARASLPPDFIPLGINDEVRMGETIFNVGAPGGRGIVATRGIISADAFTGVNPLSISLQSSTAFDEMIQFDAASNPGNSGGPLINLLGQQVGLVVSSVAKEEGIHFAIPNKPVRESIGNILCSELKNRYISGITIDRQLESVMVTRVDKDSAAAESGIQVGDQILSLDGRLLRDSMDWIFSKHDWKPNQTLGLQLRRGQKDIATEVTLRQRNPQAGVAPGDVVPGLQSFVNPYDPRTPDPLNGLPDSTALSGTTGNVTATPKGCQLTDHYTVRLIGLLKIGRPGIYRVGLKSDDGSMLYLHDQLVIDNNGNHSEKLRTAWADLEAGYHPIRIDYYEDEGEQNLEFLMGSGDGDLSPVPANQWFHTAKVPTASE